MPGRRAPVGQPPSIAVGRVEGATDPGVGEGDPGSATDLVGRAAAFTGTTAGRRRPSTPVVGGPARVLDSPGWPGANRGDGGEPIAAGARVPAASGGSGAGERLRRPRR